MLNTRLKVQTALEKQCYSREITFAMIDVDISYSILFCDNSASSINLESRNPMLTGWKIYMKLKLVT